MRPIDAYLLWCLGLAMGYAAAKACQYLVAERDEI